MSGGGVRSALILVFCISPRISLAVAPVRPTVSQVIEGLENAEKLVCQSESLLIQYERIACVEVNKTVASGGYLPEEWTNAYNDGVWYVQRRFTKPKGTGKPEDPLIPKEPMTHFVKGGILLEWEGAGHPAIIDTFQTGRNVFGGLLYFRHLSMDVGKYIAEAGGSADRMDEFKRQHGDDLDHPFLPEFLKANAGEYEVSAEPTEIEGRPCWLIEWPGMDRVWVDVDRGFAIPRRIYCWGPGKPERFEYLNSDYKEVKAGVWLPFRQTELRYASIIAEKESLWRKVACRSEFIVHKLEFDTTPASFFNVTLPKQTRVVDFVRDFRYVVSDENADLFSAAVADAKGKIGGAWSRWLMLYANVALVVLILAYLSMRMIRTRRTGSLGQ